MSRLIIITFCFLLTFGGQAQKLPEGYKIDGSISWLEDPDKKMEEVARGENYLIKEYEDLYYIGIRTNTVTIGNIYYLDDDKVVVMHASAALGAIGFLKSADGQWAPEAPKFVWTHRDPAYISEDDQTDYIPFEDYYRTFDWVANTITAGSSREMEFVVSKRIVKDPKDLRISFSKLNAEGKSEVVFVNGPPLTKEPEVDTKIHNGYLPEQVEFLHYQ